MSAYALILACQGPVAAPVSPIAPGPVMDQVRAILARDETRWVEFRRDLHRHPELSGAEVRTSQKVTGELRRLGLEVRTNVGGYGVVGILRGARPGPLIAYRADMDAFASTARDPVDFPSENPGVRHICGHDIHTTVGLALASALHQVRDSLAGSVMFVFQPAEERATGARAMLADGVFARDVPVEIYGLHTAGYEQGRLATKAGPMMASVDLFNVLVSGSGDVTSAASIVTQRILALGTIDRSSMGTMQPEDFVLITMNPAQVATGQVRITGWVSVANVNARARVAGAIRTGLAGSLPAGVAVTSTYEAKSIDGVTNDSALTAAAVTATRLELGAAGMSTTALVPPGVSEDFGAFQERVPGVFFWLGVANAARGWVGLPHDPNYVADEKSIGVGALAMSTVMVHRLRIR